MGLGRNGKARLLPAPVLQEGQAHGQVEELLKGEPPPGQVQGLLILGEVDVPQGKFQFRQLIVLAEAGGQRLGEAARAGQSLLGEGGQQVVGDARGEVVDGHDTPGDIGPVCPFKDGIDHGAAAALLLHGAEEDILLPGLESPLHITLVEEGEVQDPSLVHRLELYQLQPLPDAGETGVFRRHGGDTHPRSQRGLADGVHLPPVLVVPGVTEKQIPCLLQAQLAELPRAHRPHAGELGQRGVQRHDHRGTSCL